MMISGFDHAPVVVRDLDAAVARYTALLGRAPSWVGRMPGLRHAWFQLTNIALDVLTPDGEGPAGDALRSRLEQHGEGPFAIAFSLANLDDACRVLGRRGVDVRPATVETSVDAAGQSRSQRVAFARASTTRGLQIFLAEAPAEAWPMSPPVADAESAVAAIDHVVVRTTNPEASIALYGAKLGLDLRLDRSNPDWGSRLLFFRCGDAVVEVGVALNAPVTDERDRLGGYAWRAPEPEAAHARMAAEGLDVSELRKGRKVGTSVFTVRDAVGGPNLIISAASASED
ncbi:MAG TPA: VOC family protein [Caulobacteraceae bacterium]|nr:VOC family protein [Caulobacteraceae bacterium]